MEPETTAVGRAALIPQAASVSLTAGDLDSAKLHAVASTASSLLDHLAALFPLFRTVFGRSVQLAANLQLSTSMHGSESAS